MNHRIGFALAFWGAVVGIFQLHAHAQVERFFCTTSWSELSENRPSLYDTLDFIVQSQTDPLGCSNGVENAEDFLTAEVFPGLRELRGNDVVRYAGYAKRYFREPEYNRIRRQARDLFPRACAAGIEEFCLFGGANKLDWEVSPDILFYRNSPGRIGDKTDGNSQYQTAIAYFEQACEFGSGIGCSVVGILRRRAGPIEIRNNRQALYYFDVGCTRYHEFSSCNGLRIMIEEGSDAVADHSKYGMVSAAAMTAIICDKFGERQKRGPELNSPRCAIE